MAEREQWKTINGTHVLVKGNKLPIGKLDNLNKMNTPKAKKRKKK